jgi:hypothetical protein
MRLLYGSIASAVVGGVAALIVFVPNTGHNTATPIDRTKPAQRYRVPRTVPATRAERTAAQRTLTAFIKSAVPRRRLASSWLLATAHMKRGTSYSEWLAGDLPVVPYPAAAFRTSGSVLKYSYRHVLGFDVLVLPKQNAAGRKAGQQIYTCELHQVRGRWLVDFCYPRKTL